MLWKVSYFLVTNTLELHKVLIASVYLRGPAKDWYDDYHHWFTNDEERLSYYNIRAQFVSYFIPLNEEFDNEQELYNLCKTISVQEYTMRFRQFITRLLENQRSQKTSWPSTFKA